MKGSRLLLVVIVASTLALAGCVDDVDLSESDASVSDQGTNSEQAGDVAVELDGDLEIHHIDLGQADATLVIEPSGETMLVDSGDWRNDGELVLEYLDAQGVERIDHLVSTHAHADHIGGHAAVIEHYETERGGIGAIYDSGVVTGTQTYDRYLDAVEDHDVTLYEVQDGDTFAFGDADVDFLNPPAGESGSDLHYNSVVLTITYGEVTYLTTGDAEADAESRLVDAHGEALDADIYQAGHHGSSTSSTDPFLDRVDPGVAVISSAYESQYGHPHDEVLESFADRSIETYWTAVHGSVVVTTDGESVTVDSESAAPTDGDALLEEKPAQAESTSEDGARIGQPMVHGSGGVTMTP